MTVVQYAPMGDPIELRLHGYELTIRLKDAKTLKSVKNTNQRISEKVEKQEKLHPGYGKAESFITGKRRLRCLKGDTDVCSCGKSELWKDDIV